MKVAECDTFEFQRTETSKLEYIHDVDEYSIRLTMQEWNNSETAREEII